MVVEAIAIEPNGPAHRAGLREGDILLALNGENIATVDDIHRMLSGVSAGSKITLNVLRGEKRSDVDVVTGEM